MTLASRRLIRKRPFIVVSLVGGLQAIGSEVAADTNRRAVMNAPAKAVAAVSLKREEVIFKSLFVSSNPPAGPCQIQCRERANYIMLCVFNGACRRSVGTTGGICRRLGKITAGAGGIVADPVRNRTCATNVVRFRSVGVAEPLGPWQQNRQHRLELARVTPPASARRLGQRLDDLVVARRDDRPARFGGRAIIEQRGPPREAQKIDQRPQGGLGVGDQLLIDLGMAGDR